MTETNEAVTLDAAKQARRLWNRAQAAFGRNDQDVTALGEALDFGLRTAEILAGDRLEAVRDRFPHSIGVLLDAPPPDVSVQRDAIEIPRSLGFTDVLDLLSDESLECVGPELHRGWEDRRFSCRRSRATAQEAIGICLSANERQALLTLSAYRNRIFRLPPPVRIVPAEIRHAFPALISLVKGLWP